MSIALALVGCGSSGAASDASDAKGPADGLVEALEAGDAPDAEGLVEAASEPFEIVEPDSGPTYPLDPPGPGFHVAGRAILDAAGRSLLLHGVSVCNTAKYAPDFLPWHQPADFLRLAGLGFDHVRLLTFWAAIMPTEGVLDAVTLDAYAQRVDWAAEAGLLVVVDMHQDVFGVGFGEDGAPRWACDEATYASYVPTSPWFMNYLKPEVQACFDRFWSDDALFQRYVDAWVAVAERVKGNPAVVGFELFNEPNWGSMAVNPWVTTVYQPRMEQLTAALRAVAPDKLIFLQGTQLTSVGHVDPFVPFADPAVVYTPHYYHPLVHDGGAYDRATMKPQLEATLDKIATMADLLGGVPTWMGEMGGPTETAGFDLYVADLLDSLARRGWGWATYSDDPSGGFALRTAPGVFKADYVRALGHPYARRVPGPVLEQSADVVAGTSMTRFTWAYDAPLVLWVGMPQADGGLPVVSVTREGRADDAGVTCAQDAAAVAGVWSCPAMGEHPVFGATYRVEIAASTPVAPPQQRSVR